ncbi:hypothetical protein [Moorena sp. SIO3H5]|uniref:hypothetical protein n=1 Tax=Moorena sp. SIO3H5 TaxID=2607834 RepID=UPI0013B95538|nr:hypothetical protein [Moorena sp. SIO3H5]NEO68995.1 hypothetical protein [Moorena sp. SIO3H5]
MGSSPLNPPSLGDLNGMGWECGELDKISNCRGNPQDLPAPCSLLPTPCSLFPIPYQLPINNHVTSYYDYH